MGGMMIGGDKSSSLDPLFKAWGVEMDKSKVLADATAALSVGSPNGRPVRHLGILGLKQSNFTRDDVITSTLNSVNFATSGAVKKLDGGKTDVEVLVKSSANAMLMDAAKYAFLFDPSSLYKDFTATGDEYVMAVRITGKVSSAYPEGRPVDKPKEEDKDAADKGDSSKIS